MGNHAIPIDTWNAVLAAFREEPGNVSAAAKRAGVSRNTARRAWMDGWPRLERRPMQDIVAEEQAAARAALADQEAKRKAMDADERAQRVKENSNKAFEDVVAVRKQEAGLVRSQRQNVMGLVGVTRFALQGMLEQAQKLGLDLKRGIDPVTKKPFTVQQRMRFMEQLARIVSRSSEAAGEVVRSERLILGEPTDIIANAPGSLQDVVDEFHATTRAVQRVARQGLVVLPGGKGKAGDGGG